MTTLAGSAQRIDPATRRALAALSLSMLLSSLGTSIANVGLPALGRAFGATFQQAQWIVLAYLLAVTGASVGVGRLGDLLGRRRLLAMGIVMFTVASLWCALAQRFGMLLAGRALQGLGAAAMMTLALALAGALAPQARSGSVMGLLGTMSAAGTALGPLLGGLLLAWGGWRALFLAKLPLGALALLLALRWLPADRPAHLQDRPAFDGAGAALLAVALAAYALALAPGHGRFGPLNLVLLGGAVLGAWLFVRVERRAASPLVRLALLRDPVLGAGLAANALVAAVMMATLVVGPFYLVAGLGLDSARAGIVMACGPVAAALAGWPAGRMADRWGARRIAGVGLAGIAAGCALLAAAPLRMGVAAYAIPLVLVTLAYALFQAANNGAVMAAAGPAQRGVAAGLLGLSRNLGLVTGAAGIGTVFALGMGARVGAQVPAQAVAHGMRIGFAAAAALGAAALCIVWRARAGARPAAPDKGCYR